MRLFKTSGYRAPDLKAQLLASLPPATRARIEQADKTEIELAPNAARGATMERAPQRGQRTPVPDMFTWAYHATDRRYLPAINRVGLEPRMPSDPGMPFGADRPAVFFAATPRSAELWGNVLLRFPWPEDEQESTWGDTLFDVTHGVYQSEYWTPHGVPPVALQVLQDGMWRPLRKRA